MEKITFNIVDKHITISAIKKNKRWTLATRSKNKNADKHNLTAEGLWSVVKDTANERGSTPKESKISKNKERLGVEWAAIRMMSGAKPSIVEMPNGLWLYIDRTSHNEYNLRVIEPLGTKKTEPVVMKKEEAIQTAVRLNGGVKQEVNHT